MNIFKTLLLGAALSFNSYSSDSDNEGGSFSSHIKYEEKEAGQLLSEDIRGFLSGKQERHIYPISTAVNDGQTTWAEKFVRFAIELCLQSLNKNEEEQATALEKGNALFNVLIEVSAPKVEYPHFEYKGPEYGDGHHNAYDSEEECPNDNLIMVDGIQVEKRYDDENNFHYYLDGDFNKIPLNGEWYGVRYENGRVVEKEQKIEQSGYELDQPLTGLDFDENPHFKTFKKLEEEQKKFRERLESRSKIKPEPKHSSKKVDPLKKLDRERNQAEAKIAKEILEQGITAQEQMKLTECLGRKNLTQAEKNEMERLLLKKQLKEMNDRNKLLRNDLNESMNSLVKKNREIDIKNEKIAEISSKDKKDLNQLNRSSSRIKKSNQKEFAKDVEEKGNLSD